MLLIIYSFMIYFSIVNQLLLSDYKLCIYYSHCVGWALSLYIYILTKKEREKKKPREKHDFSFLSAIILILNTDYSIRLWTHPVTTCFMLHTCLSTDKQNCLRWMMRKKVEKQHSRGRKGKEQREKKADNDAIHVFLLIYMA